MDDVSILTYMALIKSISGIRGTIGGNEGDNLTPVDVLNFTIAYGAWLKNMGFGNKVIVGRDARISGGIIRNLVVSTLQSLGFDVIDIGLATTPTVEIAVSYENAAGGVIITASHNPKDWNALKFLNNEGEFLDSSAGNWILDYLLDKKTEFSQIGNLGKLTFEDKYLDIHIEKIISHSYIDINAIKNKNFKIVLDPINSVGAFAVTKLLNALGVDDIILVCGDVNGDFEHNPEPLPENLTLLSKKVVELGADIGISVDPDVDRLCFVCEDGSFFGEEYTLVAVTDYVLSKKSGATVSNLSSTKSLREITEKHGCEYFGAPVGEVNVVKKMKDVGAVIGGEGNGGVIFPDIHYGRDALVGIALFLTHLAHKNISIKKMRELYPNYYISKNKVTLDKNSSVVDIIKNLKSKYLSFKQNDEDGLKIEFPDGWVHIRASNTEPILRIYSESNTESSALNMSNKIINDISIFL